MPRFISNPDHVVPPVPDEKWGFGGLEFTDSDGWGISAFGNARIKYNISTSKIEFSENGAAYFSISGLASLIWSRVANTISPTNAGDAVNFDTSVVKSGLNNVDWLVQLRVGGGGYVGLVYVNDDNRVMLGSKPGGANTAATAIDCNAPLMPPRLTTVQRLAIAVPAQGMLVEDTDLDRLCRYNGVMWVRLSEEPLTSPGFTNEGGFYVSLTNKTGAPSVKGTVVSASTATASAFIKQTTEYESIGVVYEDGIADGQLCRVVVSGVADVLLKDATGSTVGQWLASADTDGRAVAAALPAPPATDNHFKEIGHVLQTVVAGVSQLCRAILHFN